MIASLHGKLQTRAHDALIVNVAGVGYRVRVPAPLLASLDAVGSDVQLFTHLHVREDELSLYGFATEDELNLFETLLTVSGIGPKIGLGILASAATDTIRFAISQGNVDMLTALPGIGKKTAQRLVLELKGKVDVSGLKDAGELSAADEDVVDALLNLGYSAAEATRAARAVPANVSSVEERVRIALQNMGGK
ncbi:MAG: Holliday junction branch migration protein RuvA [Chloroflexi bacterium]|nr:Holliday junction branch migration protein RuvA [Chloroflexota bacterium]MBI3741375.1 Holliday junction branch migration protein RuvA [Chloroflexota bacterium]